jgi:hypothetical protein
VAPSLKLKEENIQRLATGITDYLRVEVTDTGPGVSKVGDYVIVMTEAGCLLSLAVDLLSLSYYMLLILTLLNRILSLYCFHRQISCWC